MVPVRCYVFLSFDICINWQQEQRRRVNIDTHMDICTWPSGPTNVHPPLNSKFTTGIVITQNVEDPSHVKCKLEAVPRDHIDLGLRNMNSPDKMFSWKRKIGNETDRIELKYKHTSKFHLLNIKTGVCVLVHWQSQHQIRAITLHQWHVHSYDFLMLMYQWHSIRYDLGKWKYQAKQHDLQ